MLARLARLVSLVTRLMPGLLRNSTSRTQSRVLKKAATALIMAALPADNAILHLYFSQVVPPATKAEILRAVEAGMIS
jgi:hypothetical protein